MRQAVNQWPFTFRDGRQAHATPKITFILPHRGRDRIPLLETVVSSILGQRGVAVECIVVEQNATREVGELLHGVRYIHLPHPVDSVSWHKSWAYNVGALAARADILVCHDADILVPQDYGREILKYLCDGDKEVVHLQRFLFCLSRNDTETVTTCLSLADRCTPVRVRQNWKGGTLAIRRESFFRLGGFDERFVGWSGEDQEFYDRCRMLKGWRHGYLPFIHLWHASQETKLTQARQTSSQFTGKVMSTPREQRVRELLDRQGLCASLEPEAYVDQSCSSQR